MNCRLSQSQGQHCAGIIQIRLRRSNALRLQIGLFVCCKMALAGEDKTEKRELCFGKQQARCAGEQFKIESIVNIVTNQREKTI